MRISQDDFWYEEAKHRCWYKGFAPGVWASCHYYGVYMSIGRTSWVMFSSRRLKR